MNQDIIKRARLLNTNQQKQIQASSIHPLKTNFAWMKLWIIVLSFIAVKDHVSGQKLLFHYSHYREAYYFAGEQISFQIKGDNKKYTLQIEGFEDNLIVFQNYMVNPAEISYLYADNKTRLWFMMRYKYQYIFFIEGVNVLLLNVFNSGEFNKETLIFSGALLTASLLSKVFISNKFKIKNSRRLIVVK